MTPHEVYLSRLAPTGRRTMAQALTRARTLLGCEPWAVTYGALEEARRGLAEAAAPATANKILAAVRGCIRAAAALGLVIDQQALEVRGVRGSRPQPGRALASAELVALLDHADSRDQALLALLYGAMLRRSEVAALAIADVTHGAVTVRAGKGNRSRVVYLPRWADAAAAAWVVELPYLDGALFPGRGGRGHLSADGIYAILRRLARAAGVAPFSPHDLRRTAIGDMLDGGIDLATVQRVAGHASATTTARYDRRGAAALQRAAAALENLPMVER